MKRNAPSNLHQIGKFHTMRSTKHHIRCHQTSTAYMHQPSTPAGRNDADLKRVSIWRIDRFTSHNAWLGVGLHIFYYFCLLCCLVVRACTTMGVWCFAACQQMEQQCQVPLHGRRRRHHVAYTVTLCSNKICLKVRWCPRIFQELYAFDWSLVVLPLSCRYFWIILLSSVVRLLCIISMMRCWVVVRAIGGTAVMPQHDRAHSKTELCVEEVRAKLSRVWHLYMFTVIWAEYARSLAKIKCLFGDLLWPRRFGTFVVP